MRKLSIPQNKKLNQITTIRTRFNVRFTSLLQTLVIIEGSPEG
jgi:hypothetical protein